VFLNEGTCPTAGGRRVALVVPSLRGGGAERVALTLSSGFLALGIDVDLVLIRAEGPLLSEVPDGVTVVDLEASRTLLALPALAKYFRHRRPAGAIAFMDHTNLVALTARILSGRFFPLLVSVHGTFSLAHGAGSLTLRETLRFLMRMLYPRATAVVAVSAGVARDLMTQVEIPGNNLHVIYNPVDVSSLRVKAREEPGHEWLSYGQPPVVLAVGRLSPQKDFITLVRAFAIVRRERSSRLVILGEGPERGHLEALARELGVEKDVSMPGFVENPYAYMARAAVFVLSSRTEGHPVALIEALAIGTPTVATTCPSGPQEILEDGRFGRLVPVGDEEAMAAAISEALDEEDSRVTRPNLDEYSPRLTARRYLAAMGLWKEPADELSAAGPRSTRKSSCDRSVNDEWCIYG